MAVKKAVDSIAVGSRAAALQAMREKLAAELRDAAGRDAATITKELRAVLAELDQLQPAKEGSRFDELAARRAARVADPEGAQRSTGG